MRSCQLITVALLSVAAGVMPSVATNADTGGWRLPFNGTMPISQGPGVGDHVNVYNGSTIGSAEAIDYAPNGGVGVPALAPADGTVLDVLTDRNAAGEIIGFGNVVRINHSNLDGSMTTSFFAHLAPSSWSVSAGQPVVQGQQIAVMGNTGNSFGVHLHYEARNGAVAGNIYSGQSIPVRGVPGNWWNPGYSPPPGPTAVAGNDGSAQFPESVNPPPSAFSGARHLANTTSPPAAPEAHVSDITSSGVTLHMGASPSSPSDPGYAAVFDVEEARDSCKCWLPMTLPNFNAPGPTFTVSYGTGDVCYSLTKIPTGRQHCHAVASHDAASGWSPNSTYVYLLGPSQTDSGQGIPYIVATFVPGDSGAEIDFGGAPGATSYEVWGTTDAATTVVHFYSGTGSRVTVPRTVSGSSAIVQNYYISKACYGDGTCAQSPWLTVDNF